MIRFKLRYANISSILKITCYIVAIFKKRGLPMKNRIADLPEFAVCGVKF
jgi:hypothetical protein